MGGNQAPVNDDNDLPVDGNPCTNDLCMNGTPQHSNVGATMSCGPNLMCDGMGMCVGCITASNCPMPPNDCQNRVCTDGSCGFTNVAMDTPVAAADQTPGDCKEVRCNGQGGTKTDIDGNDLPVDGNVCTEDLCSVTGTPSNPPFAAGTTCTGPNNAVQCNAAGMCVQCLNDGDCPGPSTECHIAKCTSGVCGFFDPPDGMQTETQPMGDCKTQLCNGLGGFRDVANDNDAPANPSECALSMCMGGASMITNRPHGTSCTQNNGRTCDGAGVCGTTFSVVRLNGPLSSGIAASITIEERKLDGTVVGTTNLPTEPSGDNLAIVNSGSASSEGSLSLSGDGRYLIMAGYNAAVGTASVASATGINRIVARVDAASPAGINTTTVISQATAFTGNNVRGATSQDGTAFWVSGAGTIATDTPPFNGGIWYVGLGGSSPSPVQITMPTATQPNNTRWLHIFGGQLYATASSGSFFSVFPVGTGLPTTAGQTAATPNGLPIATASPFSFVFFDLDPNVAGFDTLYISDDGNATFQGIEKWTLRERGRDQP